MKNKEKNSESDHLSNQIILGSIILVHFSWGKKKSPILDCQDQDHKTKILSCSNPQKFAPSEVQLALKISSIKRASCWLISSQNYMASKLM
jgi:hypothetical protein